MMFIFIEENVRMELNEINCGHVRRREGIAASHNFSIDGKKYGQRGLRSLYLTHAKRALYQLS